MGVNPRLAPGGPHRDHRGPTHPRCRRTASWLDQLCADTSTLQLCTNAQLDKLGLSVGQQIWLAGLRDRDKDEAPPAKRSKPKGGEMDDTFVRAEPVDFTA